MPNNQKTVNGSVTGVSISEETEPKVLPASPIWYDQSINAYLEFGSDVTTVAAETINESRQDELGTPVDLDASGGFSQDVKNGTLRAKQGFFFADAHEKADTQPLNGTQVTITDVASNGTYSAASGLDVFAVQHIILVSGAGESANNGMQVVDSASATEVDISGGAEVEATPPSTLRLQTVGYQFASGDLTITVAGGTGTIASATSSWANLNIQPGEWLFFGGDFEVFQFETGVGYARVRTVSDAAITVDEVAWTGGTFGDTDGSLKAVQVFFGTFIRNELDPTLIKCRTYNVERTLGRDDNGVQSEYLEGAVMNELILNIPVTSKHTEDYNFVALDNTQRDGTEGRKGGDHVLPASEIPYNTSSTVYRLRLNLPDNTTLEPTALFEYASDASITINNNASAAKAIGVFGGFDITVGNFQVSGNITAYFRTVDAIKAVRQNRKVGFNAILAQNNLGIVYDIPLLSVGAGRLNVERNQPVTIPIELRGARNPLGYTMAYTNFSYLPDAAMPI